MEEVRRKGRKEGVTDVIFIHCVVEDGPRRKTPHVRFGVGPPFSADDVRPTVDVKECRECQVPIRVPHLPTHSRRSTSLSEWKRPDRRPQTVALPTTRRTKPRPTLRRHLDREDCLSRLVDPLLETIPDRNPRSLWGKGPSFTGTPERIPPLPFVVVEVSFRAGRVSSPGGTGGSG